MKLEEMRQAALSVNLNDSDKTVMLGHYVLDLIRVAESVRNYFQWTGVECPACDIDTITEGLPCYCPDVSEAYSNMRKTLEELEQE